MNLSDLNPRYAVMEKGGEKSHLLLDCPACKGHRISIPLIGQCKWEREGEDFASVSLSPSIAHDNGVGCKSHFFIKNGQIQMA